MINANETIDLFRRGTLDIDCTRMVLTQRKKDGERFEGQGYVRQSTDGKLHFKIYVNERDARPFGHFNTYKAGTLYEEQAFYDLEAIAFDGTRWAAAGILPDPNWNMSDMSVIVNARMQSITAHLDRSQGHYYLRIHFFEEYEVPLHHVSETEQHGDRMRIRDHAKFEACGSKFVVRQQRGSGETTVEAISETPFPAEFSFRIQEAVQYITAKPAFWRARVESKGQELCLDLVSPRRTPPQTRFDPPISPATMNFHQHVWRLFVKYLAYVVATTKGTHWNPVAYHLSNACEATAGSLDAWAIGISVAVEAVATLISLDGEKEQAGLVGLCQDRMREWFGEQLDLQALAGRINGMINGMSDRRPQDTLYLMAKTGHVEKSYVDAWRYLRNRHVHPTLRDLQKPDQTDVQMLIDHIHRVEVLLRQLTFYLIGYDGPFSDYGMHGGQSFLSKQYPLRAG